MVSKGGIRRELLSLYRRPNIEDYGKNQPQSIKMVDER